MIRKLLGSNMNELGEYGQDEVLLMISSSQSERVLVSA